jgi:hypothetical protein
MNDPAPGDGGTWDDAGDVEMRDVSDDVRMWMASMDLPGMDAEEDSE